MSDELKKRLRNMPADGLGTENIGIEAVDLIEELESTLSLRTALHGEATYVIEELEAKLAKAAEAIEFWSQALEPEIEAVIDLMQATLAELKGEK